MPVLPVAVSDDEFGRHKKAFDFRCDGGYVFFMRGIDQEYVMVYNIEGESGAKTYYAFRSLDNGLFVCETSSWDYAICEARIKLRMQDAVIRHFTRMLVDLGFSRRAARDEAINRMMNWPPPMISKEFFKDIE